MHNHRGAFAHGRAFNANIDALRHGAFAVGFAGSNNIVANQDGAFAGGYASSYAITASGDGAFAFGMADTEAITASANNATQLGPGTNALADSAQIGVAGIRFKGTTGAPGTPQNGDMWIASGYLYIRSNGTTRKVDGTDI